MIDTGMILHSDSRRLQAHMVTMAVKGGFMMHVPPGAAAYLTAEQAEHVSSGGCFTQALCLYVLRACLSDVRDGQLVRSCAHKLMCG